jgi:catechol 2,3-dioxygenase-like lactoylglutathione lyase family enzyme
MPIVTLGCRDLAAMVMFYTRLGWRDTTPYDDQYFRFETGGCLLALLPLDETLREVAAANARPPELFGGVTLALLVPTREDIERRLDVARQAGASKIVVPEDRDWGGRSGYFFDPEGNAWEVAWNPRARFDTRGALLLFGPPVAQDS